MIGFEAEAMPFASINTREAAATDPHVFQVSGLDSYTVSVQPAHAVTE